jgi:hypothetical protein
MAKRRKKRQAKWHLSSKKASLARARGHKPVALLRLYREKMESNIGRLDNIIRRREAAGE